MSDQASEGLLSPFLRRCRLAAVRPFLHGRVLDVGCGTGLLADWIPPEKYLGVDPDEPSLAEARQRNGCHQFTSSLPCVEKCYRFDTVVAVAVIEHVSDPLDFMRKLVCYLADDAEAAIVLTTPHPWYGWVHRFGAWGGLFSREANDEHQALLGCRALTDLGASCALDLIHYQRLLLGANQLAILRRGIL